MEGEHPHTETQLVRHQTSKTYEGKFGKEVASVEHRAELAMRLQCLGYELERGKRGQPEIEDYTKEYLEASSPRREQIKDRLRIRRIERAGAAQMAVHRSG